MHGTVRVAGSTGPPAITGVLEAAVTSGAIPRGQGRSWAPTGARARHGAGSKWPHPITIVISPV